VTRAAEDARALSYALGVAGFEAVEVPLLQRVWRLDALIAEGTRTDLDWIVVTSAAAADVIGIAVPKGWPNARFAAVGAATRKRLETLGFDVDIVPPQATGSDLVAALGDLRGKQVLYPRADAAAPGTADGLKRAGAALTEVVAYTNSAPPHFIEEVRARLPVDATTLMSGSAARRLAAAVPEDQRHRLGKIAVMGPSTSDAARERGLQVHAMATPHSIQGLVSAVRQLFPKEIL
jgi:uroporphyrinogen-III synthase